MGGYKCALVGCYSFESAETDRVFLTLQMTVNRFAKALAFAPLKVDGVIGRGTAQATFMVLGFIAEIDKGPIGTAAVSLESSLNTTEQIAEHAKAVADTLVQAANAYPQSTPAQPIPTRSGPSTIERMVSSANAPIKAASPETQARLNTTLQRKPDLAASLIDRVPPWAAYAAGGTFLVGTIIFAAMSLRKKKEPAGAIEGPKAPMVLNREGLTWEEWRDAAKVADRFPGMHPMKVKEWRRAWQRGMDPTEAGQH